jgi:hypothetical protein
MKAMVVALAISTCIGCSGRKNDASPPPAPTPTAAVDHQPATADMVRASDEAAIQRNSQREECKGRVTIYEGSIEVDASKYVHPVAHGDAEVDEAIPDLDRVVSSAPRIDFTLDYPFEKPFSSSITGAITLRRIIDSVRSGFRHMYEGTTVRDIPKLENKDVRGPYGQAFHVIGDLVIERIDLCDGRWLDVSIGS